MVTTADTWLRTLLMRRMHLKSIAVLGGFIYLAGILVFYPHAQRSLDQIEARNVHLQGHRHQPLHDDRVRNSSRLETGSEAGGLKTKNVEFMKVANVSVVKTKPEKAGIMNHYVQPVEDPESPGYGGSGYTIDVNNLTEAQRQRYDEGYKRFHSNEYISNLIPLHRTIRNVLEPGCLAKTYDVANLPTAGVVIVFHNEAWSLLLRTVHSVLGATPPELLTEVVIVDDASDMEHLGQPLEDYVATLPKVKLVRLAERSGLIQARMAGFHQVTGHVATFLDAHCEVPKGWLEPLLSRIREDENVLAVPATDVIDKDTLRYVPANAADQYRGGFDLDLYYMWIPQSARDNALRKDLLEPMRTPTHPGCCFAVAKSTFLRLGLYDPGLKVWGCENMELSFKTWMCGGSVEMIPCSHIGHVYRQAATFSWGSEKDLLAKNCLRVAEVWMDEYKLFYLDRIFYIHKEIDFGNVSDRVQLRKDLGCKSFQWYIDTVYPELYLPLNSTATGQIQNYAVPNQCVQSAIHWPNHKQPVFAEPCNIRALIQHFTLTKEKQMRRDEGCLTPNDERRLIVQQCADIARLQGWVYTQKDELYNMDTGQCLQLEPDNRTLAMQTCDGGVRQRWNWTRRSLTLPT